MNKKGQWSSAFEGLHQQDRQHNRDSSMLFCHGEETSNERKYLSFARRFEWSELGERKKVVTFGVSFSITSQRIKTIFFGRKKS